MDSNSDPVIPKEPHTSSRRVGGGKNVSEVYGFPIAVNQFAALQENQPAESQRSTHRGVGLMDPRTTRHLRWAAARTDNQEAKTKQAVSAIFPIENPAQEIFDNGTCVAPVAVGNSSQFIPYSFPASSSDILL